MYYNLMDFYGLKVFGLGLADIILERFKDFMREQPEPYKFLQVFYVQEKERFLNDKMNDYIKQNKSKEEASILARQGFVSAVGRALEKIIELLLKDFCIKNNVKMTNDKTLRAKRIIMTSRIRSNGLYWCILENIAFYLMEILFFIKPTRIPSKF
ncbi:hypothetical protein HpM004_04580 [Helicobacter pylori]